MTTMAEVPVGVGPGGGGPGPVDELPPPHEDKSTAKRMAAAGKSNGNLTRQWSPVPVKLIPRRMPRATRTAPPHGIIFSLIRDCGQIGKAEPLVVVTTTWALEALVPSTVTDEWRYRAGSPCWQT